MRLADVEQMQAQRHYWRYVEYVHEGRWERADYLIYLCNTVQQFIESDKPEDRILCLSMPPQHGKALRSDTPVLTRRGWVAHGSLLVGDEVVGPAGRFVRVLAVQRPYEHDCVEVTLDTRDSFVCAREHEWVVEVNRDRRGPDGHRTGRETEVLEAQHIFDGYHAKAPAIRCMDAVDGDSSLPLDPYTLGVWLGDGTSAGAQVTMHVDDAPDMLAHIPYGHYLGRHSGNAYNVSVRGILPILRGMGLLGQKHIPVDYLTASLHDRKALLRGLMDTDGTVSKDGGICEFCGVNEGLARGVFSLVRSLGYKCSFLTGDATLNGRRISDKYRVQFTPTAGDPLFHIQRKQDRVNGKKKPGREDRFRYFIKSVEEAARAEVNCITVEGGVYCAGHGLVPTHNSMSITETLPSWYLGRYPTRRVIEVSYNDDFAQKFGRRNREKVVRFGKDVFGIELSSSTAKVQEWELDNEIGGMQSRGVGGSITGNPANLIIIDDPVKNRQEAVSEVFRERIWDEWLYSIKTRLHAKGKVIVIMTRWHEDDFVARLIANETGVRYINLPCEAEEDDPLMREPGETLGVVLGKDREWLSTFKPVYMRNNGGTHAWQAMFQGRPTAMEGNLIKREWWRYYRSQSCASDPDARIRPTVFDEMLQSWDCTFKDSDGTDYVVGTVWGRVGADIYLLDLHRERMDLPTTMEAIMAMTEMWPQALVKLVEDKANGPAVIQMLRSKIPGLIPVEPKGGKAARVQAILGVIQAGNVWLPNAEDAPWVIDFVNECSSFQPNEDNMHDDQVDSMSQALNRLAYNTYHQETEGEKPPKGTIDRKAYDHREMLVSRRKSQRGLVRV